MDTINSLEYIHAEFLRLCRMAVQLSDPSLLREFMENLSAEEDKYLTGCEGVYRDTKAFLFEVIEY